VPGDFDSGVVSLASSHIYVVMFPRYLSALYKILVGISKQIHTSETTWLGQYVHGCAINRIQVCIQRFGMVSRSRTLKNVPAPRN
jgi:hypothetical protein